MNNYYEVLGLSKNTSDTEIKKAYRKLSLKFHPDKNPGDTYFEDWSKKINEAFEVLGNPATRAEYDQQLEAHLYTNTLHNHFKPSYTTHTETAPEPEPAPPAEQVSAAEILALKQLKEMLPDYLQVKKEYRSTKLAYEKIKKKSAPPIFTPRQLLIGGLALLIAISGLVYSSYQAADKASKSTELKPLPGKPLKKAQ